MNCLFSHTHTRTTFRNKGNKGNKAEIKVRKDLRAKIDKMLPHN